MGELERRESQFTSVVDRGESLIIAHHPASKVVEAVLATMQAKWAFLLQLTLCLETHLRHLTTSHQFFAECQVRNAGRIKIGGKNPNLYMTSDEETFFKFKSITYRISA